MPSTKVPNIRTRHSVFKGVTYRWECIVPSDLRARLGKTKLSETLPQDRGEAIKRAIQLNERHKALFTLLRDPQHGTDLEAKTLLGAFGIPERQLTPSELEHLPVRLENTFDRYQTVEEMPIGIRKAFQTITGTGSKSLTVALAFYKETRSASIAASLMKTTERYVQMFVEEVADLEISEIRRDHVRQFVNSLLSKDLAPSSVRVILSRLSVVMSHYITEKDLSNIAVPFKSFKIEVKADIRDQRRPYTPTEFKTLLELPKHPKDASLTLILLLIATTGARKSEIVGAQLSDVKQTATGMTLDIYANSDRSLKTKHSRRSVPLVYYPLHSLLADHITEVKAQGHTALFPKWCNRPAQVTSMCDRWIDANVSLDESVSGTRVALHSLRHTVTQSLKDAQAPIEAINALLGWSGGGMASHYGGELSMSVKREWLSKAITQIIDADNTNNNS